MAAGNVRSNFETLLARLRKPIPATSSLWHHRFRTGHQVESGLELRSGRDSYDWDGLSREVEPGRPIAIIQYTLDGEGSYEQGGQSWTMRQGASFIAIVPSGHRYYLPSHSSSWTFLWISTVHSYAVQRFTRIVNDVSPVLQLTPNSAPVIRMSSIYETLGAAGFCDTLAVEQAVIDLALEFERAALAARFPERQALLEDVRIYVLTHLHDPIIVSEMAADAGMSPSHYSHHFKACTGTTPARHIAEIRLHEVVQRLTQTRDSLKTIASETGFADANHLCKAFRRRFQVSPGQLRRRFGPASLEE